MREVLSFIGDYLPSASFPVLLILKSSILLAAGAVITLLLANASSARRYTVWALTLAAVVALPLGMFGAPAWKVPTARNVPVENTFRPESSDKPAAIEPTAAQTVVSASREAGTSLEQSLPPALPLYIWLIGTAFVLFRMILGRVSIEAITRRAVSLDDDDWQSLLDNEMRLLEIDRKIRLALTDAITTPVAAGIFSPVILVPRGAEHWSAEHRRVVLRHELAHIARGDAFICLVSGIASALYWFNPLVWMACRRLRAEQERSCDDRVVTLGIPAPDYAAHLLEVARSATNPGIHGFVSVAMARPSQLEGRLLALLRDHDRTPMSRSRRVAWTIAVFALAGALSAAHPVIAESAIVFRSQTAPVLVYAPLPEKKAVVPDAPKFPDSIASGDVAVESGGTLYLDLDTGADIIVTGSSSNRVVMRAAATNGDRRKVWVTLNNEGSNARIKSGYRDDAPSHSSHVRLTISVPRRFNIRIASAGGEVRITGVEGSFSGHTGGGDINIAKANGSATLTTGGGDVTVLDSDLSGSVSTGAGAVLIQGVTGGLKGSSGTGNVMYGGGSNGSTITYSAASSKGVRTGSDGRTYISKSGGSVTINTAPNGASISTGGGSVAVGASAGAVDVNTGAGDVRVGPLRGSAKVGTGAGDVTITIDDPSKPVNIMSGAGTVTLIVPRNWSADLDLETAFTENNGGATRIRGDIPLTSTVTPSWDSSEGTPRRYVRVRQSIGGGGPRVRVRTVNGDIIIRQR
jgi:beta-lactamase regulating signal transducer with metallopeptidase domain